MSKVVDNLLWIKERIEKAAVKAGRGPSEVLLVAVSKTIGVEKIEEAISAGATVFGENYVQEAKEKIEKIGHQIRWHMIGHLQTNKAKKAVNLFDMIQSVDSIDLAKEINKRAGQLDKRISVLIEVNVSGEATKSGAERETAVSLVSEVGGLTNIKVEGLMTMPPYFSNPQEARPYFKLLRELGEHIERQRFASVSMKELSMGMSGDFEIAIEEGATMVRVGTAIFGDRAYGRRP